MMTNQEEEEFRWAYSLVRTDIPEAQPLQFFDRVATARAAAKELAKQYPELTFGVFARGDQLYMGDPAIHENVH